MPSTNTCQLHLFTIFQVAGAVASFLYCVLLHPEVQEKLHEELDRVVGQDRFPTFDDHVNLCYLEAVRKEGIRWQPLGPLGRIFIVTLIFRTDAAAVIGVPHRCKNEDTYKGYFFPANTVFIINLWSVFRTYRKHGGSSSPPKQVRFSGPTNMGSP